MQVHWCTYFNETSKGASIACMELKKFTRESDLQSVENAFWYAWSSSLTLGAV
jgi:hypothetical protein